jgi:nucleoside-diphosphate-sugar epimerase
MRPIVVTGGAGFIGLTTVRNLVERGDERGARQPFVVTYLPATASCATCACSFSASAMTSDRLPR